jgi:hypothetical protein
VSRDCIGKIGIVLGLSSSNSMFAMRWRRSPVNVSVFAGHIADTGGDLVPLMAQAVEKGPRCDLGLRRLRYDAALLFVPCGDVVELRNHRRQRPAGQIAHLGYAAFVKAAHRSARTSAAQACQSGAPERAQV